MSFAKELKPSMKRMPLPTVLISSRRIQRRVREVAAEINRFYGTKVSVSQPLLLVVVMKGGMVFAVDLMKHLTIPYVVRTERVESSWKGSQKTSKTPIIHDPLTTKLHGRHVLVVEDLIDSGDSMTALERHYGKLRPASLKVVTVVIKPGAQTNGAILKRVQWCCFPNVDRRLWLVGYGMDHEGQLRGLPYIGFYPGNNMPPIR